MSDIDNCLSEIVTLLRNATAPDREVSITVDCQADDMRILADEEQIRQVFMNLGNNACEALSVGGTLTLSARKVKMRLSENRPEEDCLAITFYNNGPAIPEEVLPHVFEPFYTTKQAGTGLGLAIAARIVESHSGVIEVRSSDGGGTEFTVVLPARPVAEQTEDETMEEEAFAHF